MLDTQRDQGNAAANVTLPRRRFFHMAGGAIAAPLLFPQPGLSAVEPNRRPKVAVVYTSFTYRSHTHVLLENFLQPYLFNGKKTDPGVDVVSFYADQAPSGDMTAAVSRQFKIPVYKTIGEALTLGGDRLAVDAVLSIGEHGSYKTNKLGQVEYPRKRFFDEIVKVMVHSKRFVPVFSDKHLSYRWHHFIHGRAPYPVERTLIVTGALDAAMHSRANKGELRQTPELEFAYAPQDFRAMREMGATWKIITDKMPQPRGIVPHGLPATAPAG